MTALLTENLPLLAGAPNGIKKLRELILELAVRGKLVPQDPSDEPASELLKRITEEKTQLVAEGKIKKQKPPVEINEREKPFEVPLGWAWTRLGCTSSLENGDRSSNYPNKSQLVDSGIPFINAGHLQSGLVDLREMNFITRSCFDNLRAGKVQEGDILFCLRGSLGKAAIVRGISEGAIASSLVIVRMTESFSAQYLMIYFSSPLAFGMVKRFDNGTAQPNLSAADLNRFLVPVPPLAEQHRIVAKVDELMALCDRLEAQQADAESAHAQLVQALLDSLTQASDAIDFAASWKRMADHFHTLFTTESSIDALKQTLLQLAVMGKLVPQDPSDESASKLLKRIDEEKRRLVAEGKIKKQKPLTYIDEDEAPFDLPKSWQWARLGDLSELITSGSRDWAQHYSNDGAIFVRMGNLSRRSYALRLSSIQRVSPPEDGEGSRTKLEPGDLLLSITGEVGLLGLIPEKFGEAYINQHVCLIRFISSVRGRFLPEALRSPLAYEQYEAPQRGIKNSFRLSDVSEILVPLPPLAEQHRIVAKVDQLMALCDQLKVRLSQARQLNEQLASTLVGQAVA
ncbi:restriction endonuclease subunit S [Pseudomonas sp. ACN5]|uniref:restriction endonuclease subunit S n=1 Tax=Pseudomonas sp. ACN5 TaxID=1920427 RepID=UPI000BB34297|nr:restriction endonuclease subunit S [Pseudomonas sp. ACN5]PBJ08466.1 Type-1 restriction enzyme EcoKI specificity protein [Pseudomonas sp. ACN5]